MPTKMNVLIAGGGVAGLEAALALRDLAGNRISQTILSPGDEFVYRPLAVAEPFTSGHARRYRLADLARAAEAELVTGALSEVDPTARRVRTGDGTSLGYDALLACPGAIVTPVFEHVTRFEDAHVDELLHGLVQDIEGGYVRRLAIVVPAPMPWPLPAYELALMAAERAWDMGAELSVVLLTPEASPLAVFGAHASHQLGQLLAARRIEVVTSAFCEIPAPQTIIAHPGGLKVDADRIVALPSLVGPAIDGLPQDGSGFIPVDEFGRVRGIDGVWAAGDATDYPLKHGGVAAQLADTAAAGIARVAGAEVDVTPFAPALEGVLFTGGRTRYIRGAGPYVDQDSGGLVAVPPGERPAKITARYLTPLLASLDAPLAPRSMTA